MRQSFIEVAKLKWKKNVFKEVLLYLQKWTHKLNRDVVGGVASRAPIQPQDE